LVEIGVSCPYGRHTDWTDAVQRDCDRWEDHLRDCSKAQSTSKLEEKQQLMAVYDTLMNLKRDAGDMEDTIRDLKEKLRFKRDDFELKNPFWFDKRFPDRALCPKCFSKRWLPQSQRPTKVTMGSGVNACRATL
jgi:hypothetical protein